jgi:hypothetical protein
MNEFKDIMKNNPEFLKPKTPKSVRHFSFKTVGDDYITVPFCGSVTEYQVIVPYINKVTCKECLLRYKAMLATESYEEAKNLLAGMVTELEPVDEEKLKQKDSKGKHTIEARQERGKKNKLARWKLNGADANSIVENIIGTNKETFYSNLIKLNAINPSTGDKLSKASDIVEKQIQNVELQQLVQN